MTLPKAEGDRFWTEAEALKVKAPALREIRSRHVTFVRPSIRVRARHLRGEEKLRHASLTALL